MKLIIARSKYAAAAKKERDDLAKALRDYGPALEAANKQIADLTLQNMRAKTAESLAEEARQVAEKALAEAKAKIVELTMTLTTAQETEATAIHRLADAHREVTTLGKTVKELRLRCEKLEQNSNAKLASTQPATVEG